MQRYTEKRAIWGEARYHRIALIWSCSD